MEVTALFDELDVPYRFTGKERDAETGLYYYGARYLDPKTSRWLSTDPALGEYIPGAPVNDEVRKKNQNLPGMGGVFNTVNYHLYHYGGNNPVRYTDPDGRTDKPTIVSNISRLEGGGGSGGGKASYIQSIRAKIAINALARQGSTAWNYSVPRGNFNANKNKCNLFVYEMTTEAGASPGLPNGHRRPSPPLAGQWADPNYKIPGWEVLSEGEKPMPGDVAAEPINYMDATGHVAIVTGEDRTTSATGSTVVENDWGFRDEQQGKVVFRRYTGDE